MQLTAAISYRELMGSYIWISPGFKFRSGGLLLLLDHRNNNGFVCFPENHFSFLPKFLNLIISFDQGILG